MQMQQTTWRATGVVAALAVALVGATACQRGERREMARETGQMGTAPADTGGPAATIYREDTGRVPGTHMSTRLEAPTQIPALQQRLDSMSKDPGYLERTRYADGYRNLLGDAVNTMSADLSRVGAADSGRFHDLSQQALEDLGGGTGDAHLKPGDVPAHVARVRRLIAMYEQATHAPLSPSAQPPRADSARRR